MSEGVNSKSRRFELAFVVAIFLGFAGYAVWVLADREPTQKELTFSYRKYVVALNDNKAPRELCDLRQSLHTLELQKQSCDRLGDRRYRCEAIVAVSGDSVVSRAFQINATYRHDGKGWSYEPSGRE